MIGLCESFRTFRSRNLFQPHSLKARWSVLLFLAWSSLTAVSAGGGTGQNCQTAYPTVKLLPGACQPVPDWCSRLTGHGAKSWSQCQARCYAGRLQFGKIVYPIDSLDKAGSGRAAHQNLNSGSWKQRSGITLFRLAVQGWRRRRLTIWHGRLYALKSGGRAWNVVYQVGKKLVELPVGSKPPKNCSDSPKSLKGHGRKLRGVRTRCRGNACVLELSMRELTRQAHELQRRHRHEVSLRLVFKAKKQVSLLSARIGLTGGRKHRGRGDSRRQDKDDGSPPAKYREFLDRRREKYWQERRRKGSGGKAKRRHEGKQRRKGRKKQHRAHQQHHRPGNFNRDRSRTSKDNAKAFWY